MTDAIVYLALVLFGLCIGSFVGAQVWRIRARQLVADKKAGDRVDHKEFTRLKKLTGINVSKDRSRCLHCGYELKWYDLVPLISWMSLRGKCRHCRRPIGWFEPLIEIGVAAFFVVSYLLWPAALTGGWEIALFALWLLAGVGWSLLFAYDLKWFLLPDLVNFAVIGLGLVSAIITIVVSADPVAAFWNVVGAVGIMAGLYLLLYIVSKGRWIGFGDIKLGLGLGLFLADWQLALLALFMANFIGTLVVFPLLATKKLSRTSRVPFGPFLIVGTIFAMLLGPTLIELYLLTLM